MALAVTLWFLAVAPSSSAAATATVPVGSDLSFWTQIFQEEFTGNTLDRQTWYPNRWFAAKCARGATASELQHYTSRPRNVSVSGGRLRLVARARSNHCGEATWSGRRPYSSGWVQTGGSRASDGSRSTPGFTMGLGYVEARIRLPAGAGLWPAVWMLPVSRSAQGLQLYPSLPEIDGLEVLGQTPKVWRFHFHSEQASAGWDYLGPDTSAGWHTIGLWRRQHRIEWYVDGRHAWTYRGTGVPPPDVRTYVILNLAVGGAAGRPGPRRAFPASMLVDYVRAWTLTGCSGDVFGTALPVCP